MLSVKIFNFLQENDNLTTSSGGMESFITGFHRPYLIESAKAYGIDIAKYMSMVKEYEIKMLQKQKREYDARK